MKINPLKIDSKSISCKVLIKCPFPSNNIALAENVGDMMSTHLEET